MTDELGESVPSALDGERVDRIVAVLLGCSRRHAADLVDAGDVLVDGTAASSRSARVAAGAHLLIRAAEPEPPEWPAADATVTVAVVYADASVIVVDKPAGLVVHPGAGNDDRTLVNGLLARYPELSEVGERDRPGIVHRLDKGTSGLLVVARTRDAHRDLTDQLRARSVMRRYDALVWGHPDNPEGIVEAPVGRSARTPTRMTVTPSGRPARTRYTVTATYTEPDEVAALSCRLETGRTHQIRVHLRSIGHPVVGDTRYGGGSGPFGLERPFLHAVELSFVHPTKREELRFTSALPADLEAVVERLR